MFNLSNEQFNGIISDLTSWCECHGFATESVYNTCHGTNLQEQIYYIFGVIKALVENASQQNTNIDELFAGYAELKKFVEEYFKNLDLQKEVSEKLDVMSKDGTLETLLESVLSKTQTVDTGNYCNNNIVKQIIYSTAMSYYMGCWATRNNALEYGNILDNMDGNGTALDLNANSYGKMDCSTFVILSLLGVNFADSPYAGKTLKNKGNLGFGRQFIKTANNDTGLIRWAYEVLQFGYLNKYLYDYTSVGDIQTGDIVFFCWNNDYVESQPDDWWGKNTFEYCSHVGICVDNCSKFSSGVGILHCVNTHALTDFQDLFEYSNKLQNQHMYKKIMRPRLNCSEGYFKGLWRFRGDISDMPLVLNHSAINFSGGKMPSNMTKNEVVKTDGSLKANNKRYTTPFIPYNISMFVTNNSSNCGYNICYYTPNKTYIGYSQNKFEPYESCAYIRVEFFNRLDEDLTSTQINSIINSLLTYHTWCDNEQSFVCQEDANVKFLDTIFYFSETTKGNSQIVLNGK